MADQPAANSGLAQGGLPQFTDADLDLPYSVRTPVIKGGAPRVGGTETEAERAGAERRRGLLSLVDRYMLVVVILMLAIGGLMIYSATFDWSYQEYGSTTVIFMQHVRNLGVGLLVFAMMTLIDYRLWKRFAVLILLATVGGLIGVLLFGDGTFGARRAFFQGSYQPGELAELTIIIYLAAWLGSKNTKVQSLTFGLIPFMVLLGLVGGLVMLQPDISTAATIIVVAGVMYFLAGANMWHLAAVLGVGGAVGIAFAQSLIYAQDRLSTFVASLTDLTDTNYHAQQALIAFLNGGWLGAGLGQGRQKFGFLPSPHADSIFAVIAEELGVVGATFVVALFVLLIIRGLSIARRAPDTYGSLLASGITIWIATKALLNIASMLNLLPSTGIALPFLSFGGSALVTALAGAGLLLSISRVTARLNLPEGRGVSATYDRGWGNRWSRLSSTRDR
jgi:cell division protein FtsW